jgi:hypothetical protein
MLLLVKNNMEGLYGKLPGNAKIGKSTWYMHTLGELKHATLSKVPLSNLLKVCGSHQGRCSIYD